ncbi:hypothetical protein ABPG77_008469 [Micractinium sp. CCAP 211/92]
MVGAHGALVAVGGSPSATHSSAHAYLIERGPDLHLTASGSHSVAGGGGAAARQRSGKLLQAACRRAGWCTHGLPPLASSGLASALATRSPALKPAGQPTHLAD